MTAPASGGTGKSGFRPDIQAMRGVAVLAVVLYHSGLNLLEAGYLGVDLFFVVSGYLITGIVGRGLNAGSFRFATFYARRARRLLPAAYVVLVATTIASFFLLTSEQYAKFALNLVGAVLFGANLTLWSQTGYFAANSAFEPLLHMWSLAIEEQYYLLLPAALALVPRRYWLWLIGAATLASLAACLALGPIKPGVTFFWLPFRAWELGVGSIAALGGTSNQLRRLLVRAAPVAALAIFVALIWRLPGPTPGMGAMVVCVSSAVLILARHPAADRSRVVRALARVGDLSYSLYLVHWPLFALARVVRVDAVLPPALSVLLIVASFATAWVLYRMVEEPGRRSRLAGFRLVFAVGGASLIVLGIGLALAFAKQNGPHASRDPFVEGLAKPGCFSLETTRFDGRCTQSPTPEILVWGDSYAAHLLPALVSTTRRPIAQATKGLCAPFADLAAVGERGDETWAAGCLQFNRSVIDYIHRTPSLKVVILSARYFRTLPRFSRGAIREANGSVAAAPLGLGPTLVAQHETVARLRSLGLRIVVVSPPPPSDFDVGECWQRIVERVPIVGPHRGCVLAIRSKARSAQQLDAMLRGFESVANVPVIRLDAALCGRSSCPIAEGGRPLYRDEGHLTATGSLLVGKRLDLGETAWRTAR